MASDGLIHEAAQEFRQTRGWDRRTSKPDSYVEAAFTETRRLDFVAEKMWDITRTAIAAQVALGSSDNDLTHDCLKRLATDMKMLIRTWNALRAGWREAARDEAA